MQDGVADILAERAALDRGAGAGFFVSLLLHGSLTAFAVYAATHATPPQSVNAINIQFMKVPAAAPRAAAKPVAPKPVETPPAPQIEEPKPPKIEEPKPEVPEPPVKVEKNTVPLSPFGKSPKKGSETPPAAKPAEASAQALPGTTTDVPIGGSGVTGLEGGDFPYTLYIQGMQRRIGSNWFRPALTGGAAAVIYFRIQRNGTISEAKVETSSGNGTFDRAALSAVRSSNPLTPLPFGYSGNDLGVHLTFR